MPTQRWFPAAILLAGMAIFPALPYCDESASKKLNDIGLVGAWVYDDSPEGFRLAQRTGKPLLIVFR